MYQNYRVKYFLNICKKFDSIQILIENLIMSPERIALLEIYFPCAFFSCVQYFITYIISLKSRP